MSLAGAAIGEGFSGTAFSDRGAEFAFVASSLLRLGQHQAHWTTP